MKKNKLGSGSGSGHRKMMVERLENRSMLAGTVFVDEAQLSVGNLFLRGDNNDNGVLISEIPDENAFDDSHDYVIVGFNFGDSPVEIPSYFQSGNTRISGGVTVNGFSTRVVRDITGVISIDLKKGDDVLAVGNSIEDLVALAEGCGFGIGLGSGSGGASGSNSFPTAEIIEEPIHDDLLQTPLAMVVNTGDGHDAVVVIAHIGTHDALNGVGASLIINTGNGNDAVAVGNAEGFFFPDEEVNPNQVEPNGIPDATMLELVVSTGGGNDLVCIDHAEISAGVAVVTDDGKDSVTGHQFGAAAVTINTGSNNDLVGLTEFDVDATLSIVTGGGHDSVYARDFSAGQDHGGGLVSTRGAGAVTVVTGDGDDLVELVTFDASAVTINTGSGNDGLPFRNGLGALAVGEFFFSGPITVADAEIFTDRDHDHEFEADETAGPLTIVTGGGRDIVDIDFVDALVATVNLGAGNDVLEVHELFLTFGATILGGDGNDFVHIHDSQAGAPVVVNMGLGNDTLEIIDSFAPLLTVIGGPGTDRFINTLLITANGVYNRDGDPEPEVIVTQFELFPTLL